MLRKQPRRCAARLLSDFARLRRAGYAPARPPRPRLFAGGARRAGGGGFLFVRRRSPVRVGAVWSGSCRFRAAVCFLLLLGVVLWSCFLLFPVLLLVRARRPGLCVRRLVRRPGSSWSPRSRRVRRRPPLRGAGLSGCLRPVVAALCVAPVCCGLSPCRCGLFRSPCVGGRSNVGVCGVLRFALVVACVRAACAARRGVCRRVWPSCRCWLRGWPRRRCACCLPVGGRVLGGVLRRWPARLCAALRCAGVCLLRARGVPLGAVSGWPRAVCVCVGLFLRSRFGVLGFGGVCGGFGLAGRGVSVWLFRAPVLGRVGCRRCWRLVFWFSPGRARAKFAFLRQAFSRLALEK